MMQEIPIKNVMIGKQLEDSENYQEFLKIVKEKKIKVNLLEAGQRVNIEKNLYFDVLWPSSYKIISENPLNNNSLVCKMNYQNFSMLFTGDIEKIAEQAILKLYQDNLELLNATVLKVAHHGSKTSSSIDFLNAIKPRVAFIGVGESNRFGHPNREVIDRLEGLGVGIYRTDENGEIHIIVNDGYKIKSTICN